jgi:DNA-binding NtrC family response regulator
MPLFTKQERQLAEDIAGLAFANPFLDERIAFERRICGDQYVHHNPFWSPHPDLQPNPNIDRIGQLTGFFVQSIHARVCDGMRASREELQLFDDVVVYFLYERYREDLLKGTASYARFRSDVHEYLRDRIDPAHLFACFHQVRRAFHQIYSDIIGRSLPVARLRAAVWESIFTHDMRRYRRSVHAHMADVTTLVTGPTGTGKELVARAIARSRYIPFDEKRERFTADPSSAFIGVNLSALSPTLIESELFGHRKGSFTGALSDREGFLESCGPLGTVFLDEIGEVEPSVQVKLLRVLQTRTFQRLGDTAPRRFEGKLIAATNRNLGEEIRQGRFREDFYYRLCADTVTTPALHEQLAGNEDELRHLVRFISARVAGESEAEALTEDVLRAVAVSPGVDYRWPGNFRELEQCVRSVMLRGEYRPHGAVQGDARQRVAADVVAGNFTYDDLLRNYCTLLYARTRNYTEVAEKLGVDRRTVRAKVDETLLAALT